jgi:hypothetical protein
MSSGARGVFGAPPYRDKKKQKGVKKGFKRGIQKAGQKGVQKGDSKRDPKKKGSKKGSKKQGGEHQHQQYKAERESLGAKWKGRFGVLLGSSQAFTTRANLIDDFSDHAKELKYRCCPTLR